MTEPTRVGEILPEVVAEAIARAGPGYDRWMEQVAATGYCEHPVRLRGRVEHADRATGEVRTVYSTEREPDATLLKACGNRRASACPSCSATYQGDSFQLVAAGLRAARASPSGWSAIRGCSSPSPRPPSARSIRAGRRGCWCIPATPTARAGPARTESGRVVGSVTTLTIRGWGSHYALAVIGLVPRCCGMPWPGGCGRGPPSTCTAPWPRRPA